MNWYSRLCYCWIFSGKINKLTINYLGNSVDKVFLFELRNGRNSIPLTWLFRKRYQWKCQNYEFFPIEALSNKVSINIFIPEVHPKTITAEKMYKSIMEEPPLRINELSPEEEYNVDMVEYVSHVLTYGRFFVFHTIFNYIFNILECYF